MKNRIIFSRIDIQHNQKSYYKLDINCIDCYTMMSNITTSSLRNLILLENIFCINRSYHIERPRIKIICSIIWFFVIFIIIGVFSIEQISSIDIDLGIRVFLTYKCMELTIHVYAARFRRVCFKAISRLDDKCDDDDKYTSKLKSSTTKAVIISVVSLTVDIAGMRALSWNPGVILVLCVTISAHEAEMAFFSLILESINMRLSKLFDVTPFFGSKIFRHIIIAISHVNEEFTPRIILMFGVTITTTVIYALIIILAGSQMITSLSVYLIWRELKSLYSLWLVCSAAARTERICSKLAFHLAGRLVLDKTVSKEVNPSQHKTLRRWYKVVIHQRPRYFSGSILTIGLSVPLHLLDISINYLLIIVQIYLAYQ